MQKSLVPESGCIFIKYGSSSGKDFPTKNLYGKVRTSPIVGLLSPIVCKYKKLRQYNGRMAWINQLGCCREPKIFGFANSFFLLNKSHAHKFLEEV